jgi:hypothetical protein
VYAEAGQVGHAGDDSLRHVQRHRREPGPQWAAVLSYLQRVRLGAESVTSAESGVPWSVLKRHLDGADESPWPDWLPPRGKGTVTAIGHDPLLAEHLGPTPCMSLKAGDIVSLSITDDFAEITYVRIQGIQSYPGERLITFSYGERTAELASAGWPAEARVPMMRLFTSVYRK